MTTQGVINCKAETPDPSSANPGSQAFTVVANAGESGLDNFVGHQLGRVETVGQRRYLLVDRGGGATTWPSCARNSRVIGTASATRSWTHESIARSAGPEAIPRPTGKTASWGMTRLPGSPRPPPTETGPRFLA